MIPTCKLGCLMAYLGDCPTYLGGYPTAACPTNAYPDGVQTTGGSST